MRTRSTQPLLSNSGAFAPELPFICSGLGLESSLTLLLAIDRDQTLGLRSVVPWQADRGLNHPDRTTLRLSTAVRYLPPNRCRGAKQYLSCQLTIPYFAV
jgi:hypothetical protein